MTDAKIRQELNTLKIHIDQLDIWSRQAMDMLYQLEEKLIDKQEDEWFEKYGGMKW